MASEKRCLYEVLGLRKDCSPDEIRSAYKRLALQRHPDKLVQSGLSQAEATAQFQELAHAYEVLSDPKERAWYDSHRSQILFSDFNPSSNSVPNSVIPNLFSFFSNTVFSGYSDSGKGFYKVYSDLFNKIYLNEINFVKKLGLRLDSVREAPIMGNLDSPYGQVTAFYNYWLGFCTVMDFCWVDEYDVTAGPNRKSRRLMEEENKKLRKKARREYNETVRGLAEFVKKRDKRVIDMAVKKNAELEKKKEEERERRRKMEKERMEKAMAYQEPDWAKVDEEDEALEEAEEDSGKKRNEGKELYCVVCGKKFKSDKQWKNHEQSKKHREKVAELRESFADEEEQREEEEEMDVFEELSGDVEKVEERLREDLEIGDTDEDHGDQNHQVDQQSDEKEGFFDAEEGDEDDEMSVLEAMLSGHKSRKQTMASRPEAEVLQTRVPLENERNEAEFMEYDNRKSTRSQRGDKKDRGNKNGGTMKADLGETKDLNEDIFANSDPQIEESTSHAFLEKEGNEKRDDQSRRNHKAPSGSLDKKGAAKKDINAKSKNASKGKKVKATAKHSGNVCDRCGEEFESRNKLHKHLDDTGHATMKYR